MENTTKQPVDAFDPSLVFVRKFRWTFGSESLPATFVQSVSFDFIQKKIYLNYMEVCPDSNGEPLQNWLDGPYQEDTLTFTTYDGCGQALYEQTFSSLDVVGDKSSFDYGSSDVSVRHLTISYNSTGRKQVVSFPRDKEVIENPRETKMCYLNQEHTVQL